MPSNALTQFKVRLSEVQQLLDAHAALVRLQRANQALANGGSNLANIAAVVNHLVTQPGPGRPGQVQALNKAAISLLSGHLQGFVTDLYTESAGSLFAGRVANIQVLTDNAPTRGNPNTKNINKLFASLGFDDILDGISWQRFTNHTLRTRLNEFTMLRNNIVHGNSMNVTKDVVRSFLDSWNILADRLDDKLRTQIHAVTGILPW